MKELKSRFFDSVNRDRVYKAEEFAGYFSAFIGNGVFAFPADCMQVKAVSGLKLAISAGKCFINGYLGDSDGTDTLTPEHGGALPRADRIIIRLDLARRSMYPALLKGEEASSPSAPEIVRTGTIYDIGLAVVTVPANAVNITQANIRDTRPDSSVCGLVSGLVKQFDATDMFAEYQAAWDEFVASLGDSDHVTINTADQKARTDIFRIRSGERFSDLFKLV